MTIASINLPGFGQRVNARRRPPVDHEIVIDSFAGVGGWGVGEEAANGWAIDVAINHDPYAIANHAINHPATKHYQSDVFEVDPREVEPGRKIAHCHFSPDCTHHSKARGGAPVSDRVRGLAWIVLGWAYHRRPRVVTLENVEEFMDWGPTLLRDGKRYGDPLQKGETFLTFLAMLGCGMSISDHPALDEALAVLAHLDIPRQALIDGLGYTIEHRVIRACDYGAPTIRKRFYLVARCDGKSIIWPEKTHGESRHHKRTSKRAYVNQSGNRQDELAGSSPHPVRHSSSTTCVPISRNRKCDGCISGRIGYGELQRDSLIPYRTAAECIDWSLPCPSIFMTRHEARDYYETTGIRVIRPLKPNTLRRIANGVMRYVVNAAEPFIVQCNHGGGDRCRSIHEPINTLTASRDAHGLVVPTLVSVQNASSAGIHDAANPMPTITAWPKGGGHAIVAAFLNKHRTGATGSDLSDPMPTITAGMGSKRPAGAAHALGMTAAHLVHLRGTCRDGQAVDEPMPTLTSGGLHVGLVAAFLQTYYGSGSGKTGTDIAKPIPTIVSKDRIGLVTVVIDGETYVIVDIGMRMLQPHELLRAQFGEFADGWVLTGTNSQQVAGIGNSVCPHVSRAICKANVKVRRMEVEEVAA